jgi:hypothetical protein
VARARYDAKLAKRLLDLVMQVSLNEACARLGVSRRTVRWWLASRADFSAEYDAARLLRLDGMADEVTDLVDACDGSSQSEVTKARAQADMRRWVLAKALPSRYGDRLELASDPDAPLVSGEIDTQKLALCLVGLLEAAQPKPERPIVDVTPTEPVEDAAPALPEPLSPPISASASILSGQDSKVVALQQRRPERLPDHYWRR